MSLIIIFQFTRIYKIKYFNNIKYSIIEIIINILKKIFILINKVLYIMDSLIKLLLYIHICTCVCVCVCVYVFY